MDEEGWRAVRMALTGLLPACRAAGELDERGQKKLEAAIARAVIRAQAVVTAMLREYKEYTRKARAAKWAEPIITPPPTPHPSVLVGGVRQRRGGALGWYRPSVGVSRDVGCCQSPSGVCG